MNEKRQSGVYPLIADLLRRGKHEELYRIVFGTHSARITNEAVSITNWVNTRMFTEELIKEIKKI